MSKLATRNTLLKVATLAVAFAPLLLFLYLGLFTKLQHDDFGHLGMNIKFGPWGAMLWYCAKWSCEYTAHLFYGILAPFNYAAPSLILIIIAAVGLPGMAWLTLRLLRFHSRAKPPLATTTALAALLLVAAFHGFHSMQNLYWLAPTVEYHLPFLTLLLCIAILATVLERFPSDKVLPAGIATAVIVGFTTAGFGDMYMVFQTVVFASILACILIVRPNNRRRLWLAICAGLLLGSLASGVAQMTSPGASAHLMGKASLAAIARQVEPVRDLVPLIIRAIEDMLILAGHPPAFVSFILIFAAGMAAALTLNQPSPMNESKRARSISRWMPLSGLAIHLLLLPFLWAHNSDSIQVFGRFSWSFAIVIFINLGSIVAFAALLWQRVRFSQLLQHRNHSTLVCGAFLLGLGLLFALTQFRAVHWRATTFLFIAALSWIVLFTYSMHTIWPSAKAPNHFPIALLSMLVTALTYVALVAIPLWIQGDIDSRHFAPSSFLLVISGFLLGLSLGDSIKRAHLSTHFNVRWLRLYQIMSLILVFSVVATIIQAQLIRIPYQIEYARQLDASHQRILQMIENDDPLILETKFNFRGSTHVMDGSLLLSLRHRLMRWEEKQFYDLVFSPPNY